MSSFFCSCPSSSRICRASRARAFFAEDHQFNRVQGITIKQDVTDSIQTFKRLDQFAARPVFDLGRAGSQTRAEESDIQVAIVGDFDGGRHRVIGPRGHDLQSVRFRPGQQIIAACVGDIHRAVRAPGGRAVVHDCDIVGDRDHVLAHRPSLAAERDEHGFLRVRVRGIVPERNVDAVPESGRIRARRAELGDLEVAEQERLFPRSVEAGKHVRLDVVPEPVEALERRRCRIVAGDVVDGTEHALLVCGQDVPLVAVQRVYLHSGRVQRADDGAEARAVRHDLAG